MNTECECGLKYINICKCDIPIFELVKVNNKLFCKKCNRWEDRCINKQKTDYTPSVKNKSIPKNIASLTSKQQEQIQLNREHDSKEDVLCKCGISRLHICICPHPSFELFKLKPYIGYWCNKCHSWKDKCID